MIGKFGLSRDGRMRRMALLSSSLIGIALIAAPRPSRAQDAPVTFTVSDVGFSGGSVRVDICTQDTFLKGDCPYSGAAPAVKGETSVTVGEVPPGTYAAQIYHDANDNHAVDRGPLGIPKEALGFSRNAPLGLHGPKFQRAAFEHGTSPQNLAVRLHHFGHPARKTP